MMLSVMAMCYLLTFSDFTKITFFFKTKYDKIHDFVLGRQFTSSGKANFDS